MSQKENEKHPPIIANTSDIRVFEQSNNGKVIGIYKQVGETPLQALTRVREIHHIVGPMTYAGRLDPMAEGLLLILTDDICKDKDRFTSLDKDYTVTCAIGISTDTDDVLGIVDTRSAHLDNATHRDTKDIDWPSVLSSFEGMHNMPYHPFSSKHVLGKALHEWSRKGLIPQALWPHKEVKISNMRFHGTYEATLDSVLEQIPTQGDFRFEDIRASWQPHIGKVYTHISFSCTVSSGTYIRSIIRELSKKVSLPLVATMIKRTRVGEYMLG